MIRPFRVFIPTSVVALLLSELLLVSGCYLGVTYLLLDFQLPAEFWIYVLYEGGGLRMVLVVASILVGLYAMDLYGDIKVHSRTRLLQDLCQVIGIALLVQGFISYVVPDVRMGRGIMLYGSLLSLILLFVWRVFYSAFLLDVVAGQRILFVGENAIVREIAATLVAHPAKGLVVAGYLSDIEPLGAELPGGPVLGRIFEVRQIAEKLRPERIVVGMSERRAKMPVEDLLELRFSGFAIEDAGQTYEAVCGRICTKELRPSQLIFTGVLGPRRTSLLVQTTMNYTASLVGTLIALPAMIVAAILIKTTSRGPVLYPQVRVGKDGKLFTVYRFRTIRSGPEGQPIAAWKQQADPRVTTVGAWLHRFGLEDLPQLINVLKGEMSLVGPRPERPEFVRALSEQIPFYRQRHCVKPGVTGWAQINYMYNDTLEDTITKLEYDLYYIKNISPGLDLYILLQTLRMIIGSRGLPPA